MIEGVALILCMAWLTTVLPPRSAAAGVICDAKYPGMRDRNCFLIGQGTRAGFMSLAGEKVTPPRFEYVGVWLYGRVWCRRDYYDLMSGYFVDENGVVLNQQPVGDMSDHDFMNPDPAFWKWSFIIVRTNKSSYVYLGRNGEIGSVANPHRQGTVVRYGCIGEKVRFESADGAPLTEPIYDDALSPIRRGCIPVKIGAKWGVVDAEGRTIWPLQLDAIWRNWEADFWNVRKDGLHGAIDGKSGKIVVPIRYQAVGASKHGLIAVKLGGKWGVVNSDIETMIAPEYEEVTIATSDSVWCRKGRWGLYSVRKKRWPLRSLRWLGQGRHSVPERQILPHEYDTVDPLFRNADPNEFWLVTKASGKGVVTSKGRVALAPEFHDIACYDDGVVIVSRRGKAGEVPTRPKGVYDLLTGECLVPVEHLDFMYSTELRRKSILVRELKFKQKSHKWGLMSLETGKFFLEPVYDSLYVWGKGSVSIMQNESHALCTNTGAPIIPWQSALTLPGYGDFLPRENGSGKFICAGKAGLIHADGSITLPCEYEDVGLLSEGLVPAMQGGRWGYVDIEGEWHIEPRYEAAASFLNGYAAVRYKGKTGFIDRNGETKVDSQYEEVGNVLNGRFPFAVTKGDKKMWGIADFAGNTILPPEYDCVEWVDLEPGETRYYGKPGWLDF